MLEVIHRYKYSRALWFEPFLAELLIGAAKPELAKEKWDFIVPVPLYPAKQREREFNQAERLAKCLSAATQIPVNKRLAPARPSHVHANRAEPRGTRGECPQRLCDAATASG